MVSQTTVLGYQWKELKSDELKIGKNEVVYMNSESTLVTYQIIETEKGFKVVIEDSLTLDFDRRKKSGLFHLQKSKKPRFLI